MLPPELLLLMPLLLLLRVVLRCSASLIEFRIWPAICTVCSSMNGPLSWPWWGHVLHRVFAANPLAEHIAHTQLIPLLALLLLHTTYSTYGRIAESNTCVCAGNLTPLVGTTWTPRQSCGIYIHMQGMYILLATLRGGQPRRVEFWLAFYGLPTSNMSTKHTHNSHDALISSLIYFGAAQCSCVFGTRTRTRTRTCTRTNV